MFTDLGKTDSDKQYVITITNGAVTGSSFGAAAPAPAPGGEGGEGGE
jgi:hypothetical protein